jgi:spoIIIJ-associated protein
VKDPVYSGRDVAEALEAASRALSTPASSLRFVVLDPGRPGGLGVSPTNARIAVLLDRSTGVEEAPGNRTEDDMDVTQRLKRVLGAVIEAAGLDCTVRLEESRDALDVVVEGPGREFFLEEDAEVFKALEHLLQRMFGHEVTPRRLRLDCEGYREARDAALRAQALELADAVRADGKPRLSGPLNAYERRIVHIALADAEGIATYSVGEGADRQVTIAPADHPRD